MKIQCLGAAQGVTGSCYYIQTDSYKFLIDCGAFQGDFEVNKKNQVPFDFDPKELDFIILTHGHIDHSGRLPKLMQGNFHKPVFMTRGTASLVEILLLDSAKFHENDIDIENDKRKKAGLEPVEPFYSTEDVINLLPYFYPIDYDKVHQPVDGISFKFVSAGHLLGSGHIYLEVEGKTLMFSGDIGTQHNPLLLPPEDAPSVDYVFMESTYGNRLHDRRQNGYDLLRQAIIKAYQNRGTVIIPAFSVGRTQEIIYGLNQLPYDKTFSQIPIYVDSPMAIEATKIFNKGYQGMRPEIIKALEGKDHPFDMKQLTYVSDATKSFQLNFDKNPKVIISASGMCDAGRILHHLKAYLPKASTHVFFVGYQSEESLGRKIQNQLSPLTILNESVDNKCQVTTFHGFSGHADQGELLQWVSQQESPKKIFLIHGEKEGLACLEKLIHEKYGYETYIPELYEVIDL
jgi:metallo-beta-lactamase family protein